jgi:hypothetical protein
MGPINVLPSIVRQPHIAAQQAIGFILPRTAMELWQTIYSAADLKFL